ncbi:MAG: hypothetical protein UIH27_09005 [Ruminococcus sp.]|nr:hypothetical protein [Ruminococcus sp.]
MLEIIEFNSELFRYRPESLNQGIIYNLRYGSIFLVKGKTKDVVERIIRHGDLTIDTENKAVDYLLSKKVFVRKVEG